MKRVSGFTLIELLVVITVIGILTTVSVLGFTRYQANSRDTIRISRATTITEAIEKYYDQNGDYPGCQALTQTPQTVRSHTLFNVDLNAFTAPLATPGVNSIICGPITIGGTDAFGYVGDGSPTCVSQIVNGSCLEFTLQYKDEADGTISSIASRHSELISTSGTTTLSGSATNSTTIHLSWAQIPNASDYTLQRAPDSSFTTGVTILNMIPTNGPPVTYDDTGLITNTFYWYRVAGHSSLTNTTGSWSNKISISTP